MSELIEFLRAQLDEEEALARRLAERYRVRNEDRADHGQLYWPLPTVEARFRDASDPDIAAGLELIQAYGPARVLAEVAAKRALLELHRECAATCYVVKIMAQPYAGREGWRDEWRVEA